MTPEELAAIRKRDARGLGLIQAEMDRRALLAEVDRLNEELAEVKASRDRYSVPGIDFALAVLDDKEEDERRLNARLRPPGPGDVP